MAVRTRPQRLSGQGLETIAVVGGRIGCRFGWRHPEQVPAQRQLSGTMAVAEEAEVPDAGNPTPAFQRRRRRNLGRLRPSGKTWTRKRRINSSPDRAIVFWRLSSR